MGKDEHGTPLMGWTTRCTQDEFAEAAAVLCAQKGRVCINVEDQLTDDDRVILKANPTLGILISGTKLTVQQAWLALEEFPDRGIRFVALETESMILKGAEILESKHLNGLVIGTSYLSESSQIYDQLGLDRYRSLLRSLAKRASGMNIRPYSTSSYCTFDPSGMGDKNKGFVAEQVGFLSQYPSWGSITRYYLHLDISEQTRTLLEKNNDSPA